MFCKTSKGLYFMNLFCLTYFIFFCLLENLKFHFKRKYTVLGDDTLDSRLNWEEHINNLKAKAKRALNTMEAIAGKKWGGDRKTLKKL